MIPKKPVVTKLLRNLLEIKKPLSRRMVIKINKTDFTRIIKELINSYGFKHLSTITAIDMGSKIELIYHLIYNRTILSLKINVYKKNPVLSSIVNLIPGAILYEREIHDLFGITFKGNPDMSPLLLSDDWPNNIYPLRKDVNLKILKQGVK